MCPNGPGRLLTCPSFEIINQITSALHSLPAPRPARYWRAHEPLPWLPPHRSDGGTAVLPALSVRGAQGLAVCLGGGPGDEAWPSGLVCSACRVRPFSGWRSVEGWEGKRLGRGPRLLPSHHCPVLAQYIKRSERSGFVLGLSSLDPFYERKIEYILSSRFFSAWFITFKYFSMPIFMHIADLRGGLVEQVANQ